MPLFAIVASGTTTSAGVTLPRAERAFSVTCPSNGVACGVNVAFATVSGGAPWSVLQQRDVGGNVVVHSGGGNAVAVVLTPASPWVRVQLSTAPSDVMTYQITEIANR